MLLGREAERSQLERLLASAREGRSAVLLLVGEAGIGKTALCEEACRAAEGFTVLSCRGVESESTLAFAALGDLFHPVVDRIEAIPEPQGAALAGALALGPPVTQERYTVCAATLSLLAAVAEDAPVLAVVDGVQWVDPSSAEALLFAARRIDAEGVAVVFAARPGEAPAFEEARLPTLALDGLAPEPASQLLAERVGTPLPPEVVDRLVADTGGNPLALVEATAALPEDELAGRAPIEGPLPPGALLERAFRRRTERLSDDGHKALVVAAASDSRDLETLLHAVEELGVERPHAALEEAEALGLLEVDDERVAFRHPLVRSAVYHAASVPVRRAAHQALAAAVAGERFDERRAWHLAAAAPGPDVDVADALERTAVAAIGRGGHAEAGSALARAAELTADEPGRARRLLDAANQQRLAGRTDEALALLDEALAIAVDPLTRASVQHLRARTEMWRGAGSDAYNRLTDEAARILDQAPAVTAVMLADAVMIAVVAGDILAAQTIALRAAEAGREAGGPLELLTSLTLEAVRLLRGEQAEIELPMGVIGEIPAHQLSLFAGATLVWMERYDDARLLLGRLVERARAASAPAELPYVLACLSDLDFRTGRWPAAYAGAAESCTLAQETRQTGALPFSLVCLGRVESAQGRETEARVHLERALELAAEIRSAAFEFVARAALGAHELACGRPDAAVQQLEVVRDTVAEHGLGEPNVIQWAPDLVEAYVRCGRGADGERVLATFSEQAESSRRLWARAGAARCRGLLAGAADFELAFVEALELHAQTPAPFERARTELCFGERLRRERRRADSRDWLRSAMETFEQLGAVPWADRARTELGASGEHARRGDAPASHELTPQELQIALVVAQGSTNKEAGAQLFLSPKTIETHLGRVYRKLNVRSRTELARLLATEEIPEQVGVAP